MTTNSPIQHFAYTSEDMNINIKFYRNFIDIIEAGTLSEAAQKTKIKQSTLTMELQLLENKLGAKLVLREHGKRQLELTEVGRAFYYRAKDLCNLFTTIQEEMTSLIEGSAGILRLSVSTSRAQSLCKEILIPFAKESPGLRFEIVEESLSKLEENVLSSITELAIANGPLKNTSQLEILHSQPEQIYAVFDPIHFNFRHKKKLQLADLARQPVALTRVSYNIFMEEMYSSDYPINLIAQCSTRSTALNWAEAGQAIAIVSGNDLKQPAPGLKALPIDDKHFFTEKIIYKLARKELSPLAQKFMAYYIKQQSADSQGN